MKICRTIIGLVFLLIIPTQSVLAIPILEVDYNNHVEFTQREVVLIKKGDNPEYKNLAFDDSDWKVISLPSNWSLLFPEWNGICWYRIHVRFNEEPPDNSLGIRLGIISDVDEVFFNGHLIGKSGEFPPDRSSAYDRKRIYEIPTNLIIPKGDNVMAIRVAGLFDYENGPYKGKFEISYFQDLQREHLSKEFLDVIFVIIYLFVGVYFGLIFIRGSVDREYLFFSLFTLSSAVYLFLRTQIKYLISDNFLELKRIEYLVLFAIPLLMMEYLTFFFKRRHSIIHYIYYVFVSISLFGVIASSDVCFWNRILFYLVEPSWLIPILFGLYVSIKDFKKEADAKYILAAFPIIYIIFINDVLVDRGVFNFIRLSNYGFLIVIIGSVFIMRKRFLRLYHEVEDLKIKKAQKPPISDELKEKLDKTIAFLNENYSYDISREGIAESVGMNHDYLGKVFKEYTGMRIHEYINALRIWRASEMLQEQDQSVADIAYAVGFESLSTFYRVFQKITGESPGSYRERFINR
jgi:AraC-like DNA-binding protein